MSDNRKRHADSQGNVAELTTERLRAMAAELQDTQDELASSRQELASVKGELSALRRELTQQSQAPIDLEHPAGRHLHGGNGWSRLLVAELQHRMRNTLAVVRSIVQRSAETSESKDEYVRRLDGRLAAFARIQAGFTRDRGNGLALMQIVSEELLAHGTSLDGTLVRLEGPPLLLLDKSAELLGLAVHELAANALKHGALATQNGRLAVTWSIDVQDGVETFCLVWTESGVSIPQAPKRRGFGTELLTERIAYELGGTTTLRFGADGLLCTIRVPLDRLTIQRAQG